jgi:hypothetical protein
MGTPNEETWPGVRSLPDYKSTFPQWSGADIATQVPSLDPQGIDLLKVRLFRDFAIQFVSDASSPSSTC